VVSIGLKPSFSEDHAKTLVECPHHLIHNDIAKINGIPPSLTAKLNGQA